MFLESFFESKAKPLMKEAPTFFERGMEFSLDVLSNNPAYRYYHCKLVQNNSNNSPSVTNKARILLVTKIQMVELLPNVGIFRSDLCSVLHVQELVGLYKINYKKAQPGIVRIQFKNDSVYCYVMNDALACVNFIKANMASIGIEGSASIKSPNKLANNLKTIESAQAFYDQTIALENQFSVNPDVEIIRQVMDLMREATERFSEANDERYVGVISHIKLFLQRNDVDSLLKNSVIKEKVVTNNKFEIGEDLTSRMNSAINSTSTDSVEGDDKLYKSNKVQVDNSLEDELNGMLGDMTEEFNVLLQSFAGSNTDNFGIDSSDLDGNAEFDLQEFEELMNTHGINTESE